MTHILGYGVMVTLQILVLSFQVRILVAQQKPKHKASVFLFYTTSVYVSHKTSKEVMKDKIKDEPHVWDRPFNF